MAWLCAALVACAVPAFAQDAGPANLEHRLTPEQFKAAGLDRLTPAQLAELNRLLREEQLQLRAQARADAMAQQRAEHPPSAAMAGMQDGPIRARLVGEVAGWAPGTVFVLDNGQQWKVLKGEARLHRPLPSPEVRVVPGIAGRWFLEVHEDYPKARVYRID